MFDGLLVLDLALAESHEQHSQGRERSKRGRRTWLAHRGGSKKRPTPTARPCSRCMCGVCVCVQCVREGSCLKPGILVVCGGWGGQCQRMGGGRERRSGGGRHVDRTGEDAAGGQKFARLPCVPWCDCEAPNWLGLCVGFVCGEIKGKEEGRPVNDSTSQRDLCWRAREAQAL